MHTKSRPSDRAAALTVTAGVPVKIGCLAPGSKAGALLVDFEGNAAGPLAARSVAALNQATIREALMSRQPVVLLFENGDPRLPIVVGLLPLDPGAVLLGPLLHSPAFLVSSVEPAEVHGRALSCG